jgi:phenylpropionate dioxygenase-like ring-hydroxylating dioxygenase large terminal subunit
MLRKVQNDLLTQTGPDTPMGKMFRSYWIPALLAEELPEIDCPPVRVHLLSEQLLAFRDTNGLFGLIGEFCAHRRASLWFGRNEDCGIRCPYHGWKFDVAGQCTEIPSEDENSTYAKKVRMKAYPLVELGGILWTHMGSPEARPPLPEWEFARVPQAQTISTKRFQECNWLQALEGGIDSSHVSWLHRSELESDPLFRGASGNKYNLGDLRPVFEVVESPGGLYIGARRNAENGKYYWRITQWVMPAFTMIPPRGRHPVHGHFWIPIDDEHCWAWSFEYHPTRPLAGAEVAAVRAGKGIHVKCAPGTYRPLANKENDYLMDRRVQRAGLSYSGIEGIAMQDASLQESMGPIVDRTKEHLVQTDMGIIMARRRLLHALKSLENGVTPPGVDPVHHRVRSAAIILPQDQPFKEGAREALTVRPEVAPVSV